MIRPLQSPTGHLRIYCTEKLPVSLPERRPVLLYKDVCIRVMKVDAFNPPVREPDAEDRGSWKLDARTDIHTSEKRRKGQREDSADSRREHRQTQSHAWLLHTAITAKPTITSSGDTTTAGAANSTANSVNSGRMLRSQKDANVYYP